MQQMENENGRNIEQLKAARNASKFHNLNEDAASGN